MSSALNNVPPKTETAPAPKRGIWQEIVSIQEGKILVVGVVLACLYIVSVTLTRFWSADLFRTLVIMTGVDIIGGRAASISWGYGHNLNRWVVIASNMAIETFLVLIFYPLFVFSYYRLIVIKPLKRTMARAQNAAETYQPKIMKLGIPGLLLFVWFPFWMTGPVVGCIIGFLIGLRPKVNLSVVLTGTYLAIMCWGLLLEDFYERLKVIGPYVSLVFVGVILLLTLFIHIRYAFYAQALKREERNQEQSEGDQTP